MTEYQTVDVSTITGLKKAETLQAAGWKIVRSGIFYVYFVKKTAR